MIIYNDGEPQRRELGQLPTSDTPAAHERHTLVLRNGQVIRGTADDWKGDTLVFDTVASRQTYNASDIARLYLVGGPRARALFGNAGTTGGGTGSTAGGGGGGRGNPDATVRVEANNPWTDTGLVVRNGEQIAFRTNGTITVVKDVATGPDGQKDMPPQPRFPLPEMSVGGLIGRVGNGRPFVIGSTRTPIDMRGNGRLFLGINDDHHADNAGAFDVQIFRR